MDRLTEPKTFPKKEPRRKMRKSILHIHNSNIYSKTMGIKNDNKVSFKTGMVHYEGPKYLSSTLTPDREKAKNHGRMNLRSYNSIKKQTYPKTPVKLELNPVGDDLHAIPFTPIEVKREADNTIENVENHYNEGSVYAKSEPFNHEEWTPEMTTVDESVHLFDNATKTIEENTAIETENNTRNILAEIEDYETRLAPMVGSQLFLQRKIPKIKQMLEEKEYSMNDVFGAWDCLTPSMDKVFERQMLQIQEEKSTED